MCACRELKIFYFMDRRQERTWPQERDQQFSPVDLQSALGCQKLNIQDLRVSLETDSILQALDYSDCSYSSFQKYTQMKFLVVDERFLGSPLPGDFPASLEYLVIDNCQSSVFERLSSLANLILTGTELRCLRTLSLHAHVLFPGGMLGLPLKGATGLLFRQAQKDLVDLFLWHKGCFTI